jgi:hypothetical protein
MDKRRSHISRNIRKDPTTAQTVQIPFWLVQSSLGLILIAAGAIKLYELTCEAQDESTPTLLLMIFAEAELLGGIWMVLALRPERTRWWTAAAFAGLAASSLFQGLAGKCSCGCFGSLSVSPWFTLAFDLAAIAALFGSRSPGEAQAKIPYHPMHWLGMATIALLIGVAGWRQADLVDLVGTVTEDGRPLEEAALLFTGESGKIVLRTDHSGNFRLALVRPGLYSVSVPRRAGAPQRNLHSLSAPGRVGAPLQKPERAGRTPAKKTAQRLRQHPARQVFAGPTEPLIWVEIPKCSEYNKLIKF